MLHWKSLDTPENLEALQKRSFDAPCLIFKHSTRCEISAIAKYRLEDDWTEISGAVEPYFLDVISARPVSREIAERFEVLHESPQVLLIKNGECTFDASHLDISVAEINGALAG